MGNGVFVLSVNPSVSPNALRHEYDPKVVEREVLAYLNGGIPSVAAMAAYQFARVQSLLWWAHRGTQDIAEYLVRLHRDDPEEAFSSAAIQQANPRAVFETGRFAIGDRLRRSDELERLVQMLSYEDALQCMEAALYAVEGMLCGAAGLTLTPNELTMIKRAMGPVYRHRKARKERQAQAA